MSPETLKFIIAAALLLHGLAHGRAAFVLAGEVARPDARRALPLRTWLKPSLDRRLASGLALPFWFLSTVGFLWAALAVWGTVEATLSPSEVAAASAAISTAGIVVFSGIWPGAPSRTLSNLDTGIALGLNLVILVLVIGMGWPPPAALGD